MKANNLSIAIPNKGCDKLCHYCVSNMTGFTDANEELFEINLKKAKKMADTAGVTSVSITGKGEPTLNMNMVKRICEHFQEHPIEIQTNGLRLAQSLDGVDQLCMAGVDIFALSMDKLSDFEDMKSVIERVHYMGRTVRVTMNVTDMLPHPKNFGFMNYMLKCGEYNADQFSFRQITIPYGTDETATHIWIRQHAENNTYYEHLIAQFNDIQEREYKYPLIRILSYGAKLYDVGGISFTYFDYCIQDSAGIDDIRSLIYQEDGHMYTSWASKASRLF